MVLIRPKEEFWRIDLKVNGELKEQKKTMVALSKNVLGLGLGATRE